MPLVLRLLAKNAFRHRLRTGLTIVGLIVAVVAYGLMDTVIESWYASADAASSQRLITRSAIAMTQPLPVTHADRIRAVDGVSGLTWLSWFGGIYREPREAFAKFAVNADTYFDLFPEYKLADAERLAFQRDRQGAIIGPKLARTYGLKVGDVMPIRGDVFPGNWAFTIRGIYQPRDSKTDDTAMLVHWQLVSDTLQARRFLADASRQAGIFVVAIRKPEDAAMVSQRIDALFRDSPAQTRTETERAYQLGIVAMSRNVLISIRLVSVAVILIIMAVMANTMLLASHERLREYATLKALGFPPGFIGRLLLGESMAIALMGGLLGMALTYPASAAFVSSVGSLVDGYHVPGHTTLSQLAMTLLVGGTAAAWPAWKMSRLVIAAGLQTAA